MHESIVWQLVLAVLAGWMVTNCRAASAAATHSISSIAGLSTR